jgi:NAD(P)-dependent dehydrogenase (short-subunit alcohol dehydrogenase family)
MEAFNPFALTDKRILVTGATSGLGQAIALACARMGAEVLAVGRDEQRLSATQRALDSISSRPHATLAGDLVTTEGRHALVAWAAKPLDGVVHCAGISKLSPTRLMTEAHLKEVQSINFDAPLMLTQGLLRKNLVAQSGSIVFISSIAAHIGVAGVGVYSGTKAALIAAARCMAIEVAKHKIRVNCLSPALVVTPLFEKAMLTAGAESMARQEANHPLGFGKPEDVANASIFLLSGASRWITGTTIVMDGGLTIS